MSSNCQAPLAYAGEVARLLTRAAAHSTKSSACVDGPGERVVVDQILVCPGRSTRSLATMRARYQVIRQGEGDTRMCARQPGGCSWTRPRATTHHAVFTFVRKKGGYQIQLPGTVPGMKDATPLNRAHDGGCYGKSGPFTPLVLQPR